MSNNNPLISVIITVYNIENYIYSCIDSLMSQSYRSIEIILVDDGSTDSSGAICDDSCNRDKRITVLHKDNGGLSDARNCGLQIANGDYVVFVDGDDVVSPDFIAHLARPVINGEAELAACDLVEIKSASDFSRIPHKQRDIIIYTKCKSISECLIGERLTVSACGKLCKKDLWTTNPFPSGKVYEDLFTIPILFSKAETVAYVPEALYGQVMRSGSITRTKGIREKQYVDYYDAIIRNKDEFGRGYSEDVIRAFKIREITECTRLVRLYSEIENPSELSDCIYEFARTVVHNGLFSKYYIVLPTKTKLSAVLAVISPKIQSAFFQLLQLCKGAKIRWR